MLVLIGATTLVIAPWDYGKLCVGESLLYLALHANSPGESAGGHGTVDTGLDEPRAPLPEAQNLDREEAGYLARRCSLETWLKSRAPASLSVFAPPKMRP